jgi:hypothetical protein
MNIEAQKKRLAPSLFEGIKRTRNAACFKERRTVTWRAFRRDVYTTQHKYTTQHNSVFLIPHGSKWNQSKLKSYYSKGVCNMHATTTRVLGTATLADWP